MHVGELSRTFKYKYVNFLSSIIYRALSSQLTILQNAINNWHTLRDNFSDLHAETLSQTVSYSHILCVIIAKYVPF